MAVQAHHHVTDAFVPELRSRNGGSNVAVDEQQSRMMFGTQLINQGYAKILSRTWSSGQNNDLTGNEASRSRKRSREHSASLQNVRYQYHQAGLVGHEFLEKSADISNEALQILYGADSRLEQSVMTSTSGRSTSVSASATDFISSLYRQNLEIDALVSLQSESLRSGLEEASKRHCRTLFSTVEKHLQRRLLEKESEIERANRRNIELVEKLKQLSAENQIWFNVARNNEAVVASLRASLEQALLLNNTSCNRLAALEEGFGDSGGDDEYSCCFDEDDKTRRESLPPVIVPSIERECKACGVAEVCVLVLPCRHLCLCRNCESKVEMCPVCNIPAKAYIEVFVSVKE